MKQLLIIVFLIVSICSVSNANPSILDIVKVELTGESSSNPPSVSGGTPPPPISPTYYEVSIQVYQSFGETAPISVFLYRNGHFIGLMDNVIDEDCGWDPIYQKFMCSYLFEEFNWARGGSTYEYCPVANGISGSCESITVPN